MRVGVVTFPGSLDDGDAARAVRLAGGRAVPLWHAGEDLDGVDAVILPGGFSYGDYLRCGAMAHRSPVMRAVEAFAADGGPVLGICNGFQILCEAGLLPGALLRNAGLRFTCRPVRVTVGRADTPWTRGLPADGELTIPVKNGEGRYHADGDTLDRLESRGQVVLRYASGDNPNGSERDIAGVSNERGNVVGVMPHPEHAVDPVLIGGTDGRGVFEGLLAGGRASGAAATDAVPGRAAEPTAVAGDPGTGPADADTTPATDPPAAGRPPPHDAPAGRPPAGEALTAERARALAGELGLTDAELDRVMDTLGRVPTRSELGMYSVMWSEHCSYKSSKVHLATLPTDGPRVLVGPGENAGVVDVGDGLAVTFKVESHNHPSFVEPEQGAATGVGGILRDIFTMGARPIGLMDPLRFGDPEGDDAALQRRLIDGVVRGIGRYGNCVGVANLGGETAFDDAYAANPLVNVLAVGVLPRERLQLARAERPGDLAVLLGSATGRDGIGGASVLASAGFEEDDEDKRPTVQVGDPFAEKLLIECCLELYERGLVAGIQDMGAAGIACSTAELSSSAGMGMTVDLDAVPLREPSMDAWEILCSESQERMLALVRPGDLADVRAVAGRWGVPASVVGEVVDGDALTVRRDGRVVARVPARSLADEGPSYDRPARRPAVRDDLEAVDADDTGAVRDRVGDLGEAALRVVARPGAASTEWVWEQYDRLVRSGTVLGPGMGDAGVVRLPDSSRAVALSTDGNGRWCRVDPREGTRRLVAEAHRNVACTGARPLATTNCLNFGSPERPAVMWEFTEAVAGLGEACRSLQVPVTGGNVSFYNETAGPDGDSRAIHPTPVVGVLGLLEQAGEAVGLALRRAGDELVRLGAPTAPGLAGSRLRQVLDLPLGGALAPVDLDAEAALAGVLVAAAGRGLLASAHDVSAGGLVACLAESCLAGGLGVQVTAAEELGPVQRLFSESPGRVVVSVDPADRGPLQQLAADHGVPAEPLGTVGGGSLRVAGVLDLPLDRLREAAATALPEAMGEQTG